MTQNVRYFALSTKITKRNEEIHYLSVEILPCGVCCECAQKHLRVDDAICCDVVCLLLCFSRRAHQPDAIIYIMANLHVTASAETYSINNEAINYLRKHKLVEGRKNNLYLSGELSRAIDAEASYIRNKAFDDQYYKDLIVSYIRQYSSVSKKQIRTLLWDKLPDVLTDQQKESKVHNLVMAMRKKGTIKPNSSSHQMHISIIMKR